MRVERGPADVRAHFADKETLLTSRLEDLRNSLSERQRQAPGSLGFSLAMLEHARSHLPVWSAIVGRDSGALVLQRIQSMIAALVGVDLGALTFKGTPAQRDLAVQYIAGAFMAVLTWWLDQGAKLPPEEVDAIFRQLVLQGVGGEWGLRANAKGKASHLKSM